MDLNTTETINDETNSTTPGSGTTEPIVTVVVEEVYPHKILIAEKNIDVKELPKEIRNQLQSFSLSVGRYNKSKSEKDADSLKKSSVVMAHDIQSWLEKDLPDNTVAEVVEPVKEVVVAKTEPVVEKKLDEPEIKPIGNNGNADDNSKSGDEGVEDNKNEDEQFNYVPPRVFKRPEPRPRFIRPPSKPIELTPEQKVLKALDANGFIHYNDLCAIMGVKSADFSVTLGNTVFDNEPMTDYYYVRK